MHTPGPWRTEGGAIYSVAHERDYSMNPKDAPYIWRVAPTVNGKTEEEWRANAALIAAAPALLTALKQIAIGAGEAYDGLTYEEIADIANKAIATATEF